MAQLKDSIINGNLEIANNIVLRRNENNGLKGTHSNGDVVSMVDFSETDNLRIGYGNYTSENGITSVYGQDVNLWCGKVKNLTRPYHRAGDIIEFTIRTTGYVTENGKNVVFTIPITKPVIGNPIATATSENGFILVQGGNYTHGSDGDASTPVYVQPTSYSVDENYESGFIVTAFFDVVTNAINNDVIGIKWDGIITLT